MSKPTDLFARISRQLRPDEMITTYTLHNAHRDDGPVVDKVFTYAKGWDGPVSETLAKRLRALRTGGGGSGSRLGPFVFEVATRDEVKQIVTRERLARLNRDSEDPEMEALEGNLKWSAAPESEKEAKRADRRAALARQRAKQPKRAGAVEAAPVAPRAGTRAPAPPSRRQRAAAV